MYLWCMRIGQVKRNQFLTTHTTLKEALRGDHFSLALKLVVIRNTSKLSLNGDIKIRSPANSHFVFSNHN